MNPRSDIRTPPKTHGSGVNELFDLLTANTEWHDAAACRGLPVDWF